MGVYRDAAGDVESVEICFLCKKEAERKAARYQAEVEAEMAAECTVTEGEDNLGVYTLHEFDTVQEAQDFADDKNDAGHVTTVNGVFVTCYR